MSEPYQPSNGTEGICFMEEFCFRCVKDRGFANSYLGIDGCPIAAASMAYNVDDPNYPKEWIQDGEGARCTAFVEDVGQEWPDPHLLSDAEKAAQTQMEFDCTSPSPTVAPKA